jgi:hypothetical protein
MRYFSVAGNSMQGTLDDAFDFSSLAPLPDLAFLDLSMNGFSGSVLAKVFARWPTGSLRVQRHQHGSRRQRFEPANARVEQLRWGMGSWWRPQGGVRVVAVGARGGGVLCYGAAGTTPMTSVWGKKRLGRLLKKWHRRRACGRVYL